MRTSIDTNREGKALKAAVKEGQKTTVEWKIADAPAREKRPHTTPFVTFLVYCLKIAAAGIVVVGTVFGANEVLVLLLK